VLAERLKFSCDAYRTEKNDFIGPMVIETPNVFLDSVTLSSYLEQEFTDLLNDPDYADYAVILAAVDDTSFGGNGNGTPVDELTNIFVYGTSQIPFGTVSPQEALDPEDVLITYRNFGDIVLYGIDFALACGLNQNWTIGGSFSYISENLFEKSATQIHDIYLNVPKYKFGIFLQYTNINTGISADSRLRFVDGFEMYGPFIGTTVESFTVVDLNLGYRLPYRSKLTVTVQNLFNNKHIEFVGAPEIGRLALLRISHRF
jgi:iron complex outermembrane receptor protein